MLTSNLLPLQGADQQGKHQIPPHKAVLFLLFFFTPLGLLHSTLTKSEQSLVHNTHQPAHTSVNPSLISGSSGPSATRRSTSHIPMERVHNGCIRACSAAKSFLDSQAKSKEFKESGAEQALRVELSCWAMRVTGPGV
jgi:hypothetical protein